ncbi:MAG: RHS repeat domain-containing protein, partial [Candidatus Hadarchaeum sp.]|uniref:RHS repeat domain-containing protein n=1 Tax=Candidatus Hadarchaeum sp. TaxID=2883567 RepID=UPI003D147021
MTGSEARKTNTTALVSPPSRPAHGFSYTVLDQQSEYLPPSVGSWDPATRYSYDADGQLTQVQRPDGEVVSFTYDGEGRLTGISSSWGLASFTYDLK